MTPASLAILSLLLAGGPTLEVARVDGITITRDDVASRIAAAGAQGRSITPSQAAESLIVDVLLAGEGRRRRLHATPKVKERVAEQVRHAAVQLLVEEFATIAEPQEAELRRLFHATADTVAFQSLTFETRERAQSAADRIRKGASLAAEAPGAVTSRLASAGQEVPPVIRGELAPDLGRSLFAAAPGTVVGPVEAGPGWVVAVVTRATIGGDAEFAQRRDTLRVFAQRQASAQAKEHVVEQLRRQAKIKLDEAFLRSLQGTEATPSQLDTVVATVGDVSVRYREIFPSVRAIGAGGGHMASAPVKIKIARQAIDDRLLGDAAIRRGLDRRPEVTARAAEFERNAVSAALVDEVRASVPPPSEEEIEAFYRENASRFGRPFAAVLSDCARGAAEQKRIRALMDLVEDLRRRRDVHIDRAALSRVDGR